MATPTPCSFPGRVVTVFDRRLYVHEGIIGDLRWIENEWRKRGGHAAYPVRSDTGAYNCRKTTSGTRWSEHSRGWAVDINWNTNPFGRHLVTDMPVWFRELWKARGFGWGGDWNSVKDAMHFSKAPREGGDGVLYRPAGIKTEPRKEWDEMASKQEIEDVFLDALTKQVPKLVQESLNLWPGTSGFVAHAGQTVTTVPGHVVWVSASDVTKVRYHWTDRDGQQGTAPKTFEVGPGAAALEPPYKGSLLHVKVAAGGPLTVQTFYKQY